MHKDLEYQIDSFKSTISLMKDVVMFSQSRYDNAIMAHGKVKGKQRFIDSSEIEQEYFTKTLKELRNNYEFIVRHNVLVPKPNFREVKQELKREYRELRNEICKLYSK